MLSFRDKLEALRALNAATDEDLGREHVDGWSPPVSMSHGVPTLQSHEYRRPSPLLATLFSFAGRWERAFREQTLLGVREMEHVWRPDSPSFAQVCMRRDLWDWSVVAQRGLEDLTLLALDSRERTEVYAVWPGAADIASTEPTIVEYTSGDEKVHQDLESYVDGLLKAGRPRDWPEAERNLLVELVRRAHGATGRRARRSQTADNAPRGADTPPPRGPRKGSA